MAKSANFYTHPNTDFCVTSCASSFSVTHNGLSCSALFVGHTFPALLCLWHCLLFCVYFTVFDGVFNFLLAGCVQCSCQLYVYGEACPFGFPSVSLSACLSVYLTFYRSCHQPLGLVSVPFCNHPNSALGIMTSASLTAIVILGKSAAVTPALQDVSTQRLVMLVLVS